MNRSIRGTPAAACGAAVQRDYPVAPHRPSYSGTSQLLALFEAQPSECSMKKPCPCSAISFRLAGRR